MSTDQEIFDGAEPVEEPTEVVEEVTEEPKGEEPEAEVVAEEETPAEESPSSEESNVPITALHGERDRRKAAELRNKELEEQLNSQPKPDPTSVFEDEAKFRAEITSDFEQRLLTTRLEMSERYSRNTHGDEAVDSALDWFVPAAKESPLLQQKFNDAGNDVGEVVRLYNAHIEAEKLQDVDAYKAELKAEAKAEALKEIEAEQAKKSTLLDSIPDSLVSDPSAGNLNSKAFKSPTDEELFDQ